MDRLATRVAGNIHGAESSNERMSAALSALWVPLNFPGNAMTNIFVRTIHLFIFSLACLALAPAGAKDLPQTIEAIKPSVVGIGTFLPTRSPSVVFSGTGFVVGDGLTVITNAHVVKGMINGEANEVTGIIVGKGEAIEFRSAAVVSIDTEHDLARLKVNGAPLPAMEIGDSGKVLEGQSIAFTGFPLGMVLGLHHVTHRGIVSAVTPIVMPAIDSKKLDVNMIAQLRKAPYFIFQIDGTAYPGNSGSPLYDPETGMVYGVINSGFVKGLKETAITNPSGITYAIPARYVRDLLLKGVP
jgi:serine protease Do